MTEDFAVLIIDMFHYDEESEMVLGGFPSFDLAKEFARRRVRDSVELFRQPEQSRDALKRMWYMFGEDASVLQSDPHYCASSELDFFIDNPATPDERDWKAVKEIAGIK
jgi:hypothetical protein